MEQLKNQTNYAELYASSKQAFEQQRHLLAAGDKEALPKETHAEIASRIDPIFAVAIRKYLPGILPYCNTPIDMAEALSGLILMGEIKEIPREAVPFIGRGVYAAPFFVAEDPEKVKELLDSVNEEGYTKKEIRDYFFKKQNHFGQLVTCAGILSGTELLRVLSENSEKTRQMVLEHNFLEFKWRNIRV